MKALIIILSTVLSANLALANTVCVRLFDQKLPSASQAARVEYSFDSRLNSILKTRDSIESMATQKKTNAEIVKVPMTDLKTDIQSQIDLLENAKKDLEVSGAFLRKMIEIQQTNLEKIKNNPINLEQHFRLSMKTMLLLDQRIENPPESSKYKMSAKEQTRLAGFLKDEIKDKEFLKSFPRIARFTSEWEKSAKATSTETHRILVFTTLDTKIPEFNKFLSPDISIVGLVDFISHPDGTPIKEGPIGFAEHDLSHHGLNREQLKTWKNSGFTYMQRRLLFFEIRKNYLEARENLDPKSRMSLDILYFEFFHEDTNIFSKYMRALHKSDGTFKDPYNLHTAKVLTYAEVVGLGLSSKDVFPDEMKQSTLSTAGTDSISTLHKSMKPTWDLITEIWLKSYKSLRD